MLTTQRAALLALLSISLGRPALSQAPATSTPASTIPIRELGAVTAVSKDTLGPRIVARGLSNGNIVVGVFAFGGTNDRRRVKLFDSTLQQVTLVMDSTNMPQLVRFTGDSTVALDAQTTSLLVLDAAGKVARVMALPKTADFQNLVGFPRTPWINPAGQLLYRGALPVPRFVPQMNATTEVPTADSAPLVRADFETRRVDTLAMLRIATPTTTTWTLGPASRTVKNVLNPMTADDEWTMLPDGTIAIVRAQDYHIDWIDPDGTRRSTPKMPYLWRRLTDANKQAKIDSMKQRIDSINGANPPRTFQSSDGPIKQTVTWEAVAADKLPDYEPAIGVGSVRADLEGNLWIVPRISGSTSGGLVYDVVNRKGEIAERVQLPKGTVIVGFGPNGAVYLNRVVGNIGFLERATVR